jgi:catalase
MADKHNDHANDSVKPGEEPKKLTTTSGRPVADNQNSLSAGPRGPLMMQDFQLIEKMAHFNRERIPERVVHAKGSGAHGHFKVTKDVTRYTTAKLFSQVGKQTEVFVRFSTVGGEKGSAVPGMGYSPDKMLQARLVSYPDAHRYRVGTNYESLPVNRPKAEVNTYHRDGAMRFDANGGKAPNYEPNSFGGGWPIQADAFSA